MSVMSDLFAKARLVRATLVDVDGVSTGIAGGALTDTQLRATPVTVVASQGTPANSLITLVAAVAQTLTAAATGRRGAQVLNYAASPVYIMPGVTGTPASGAPASYVAAAVGGVPGVWNCPYAPTAGLRGVGAAAGGLSIIVW